MAMAIKPSETLDPGLKDLPKVAEVPQKSQPVESYANVVQSKATKSYTRLDLTYIEPQKIDGKPLIEVPDSIVIAGKKRWQHTIIGFVLGYNPSFQEMTRFVNSRWAEMGKVRVHNRGNGNFVFELSSDSAKMDLLEKGPWSFSRRPLILRVWEPGMPMERMEVESLPIWVKYPKLSLDLWTAEGLSLLTSQIGKPLFADRTTSEQSNLAYARVLVDIDVESELHKELTLKYKNGGVRLQPVTYEWVPDRCLICRRFGHKDTMCSAKREYVPKSDAQIESEQTSVNALVTIEGVVKDVGNKDDLEVEELGELGNVVGTEAEHSVPVADCSTNVVSNGSGDMVVLKAKSGKVNETLDMSSVNASVVIVESCGRNELNKATDNQQENGEVQVSMDYAENSNGRLNKQPGVDSSPTQQASERKTQVVAARAGPDQATHQNSFFYSS